MPSYVYVLMHRNGKRFKIGKALDIDARTYQLGKVRFNPVGSFALRFETEARSYEAEGALHRLFSNFRCESQDIVAEDGTGDGSTEFFHIDCHGHVVDFIERNLALLHAEPVYDLAHVFDPVQEARKQKRRKQVKKSRDETYADEIRRNEELIDGPLRSAIETVARLCTISVRGSQWCFVARLEDVDALKQSIDFLYGSILDIRGHGGTRLWGTRCSSVRQGKIVYRMQKDHLVTLPETTLPTVICEWASRVFDILNELRDRVVCCDDLDYHMGYWSSYVEQELAELDQRISDLEKHARGASNEQDRAELLEYAKNSYAWRRNFLDLKPDFGLRNEMREAISEAL